MSADGRSCESYIGKLCLGRRAAAHTISADVHHTRNLIVSSAELFNQYFAIKHARNSQTIVVAEYREYSITAEAKKWFRDGAHNTANALRKAG